MDRCRICAARVVCSLFAFAFCFGIFARTFNYRLDWRSLRLTLPTHTHICWLGRPFKNSIIRLWALSLEYFRLIGYLLAITRAYIHCPCKGIHCVLSLLSCSLLPSAFVCIGLEMQFIRIVIELHTSYIYMHYVLCMCVCACIFKSIAQSICTSLSLRLELGLEFELCVVCWVNTSFSLIEFYYRTKRKISFVSKATKLMKSTQMLRMSYTSEKTIHATHNK